MCSTADATTSAAANLPPPAPVDDIDTELQLSLAQLQDTVADTAATMSTPRARLEAHVAMADNLACAGAPLDHSELSSLGLGLQPFVFEGSAIADQDALEPELLQVAHTQYNRLCLGTDTFTSTQMQLHSLPVNSLNC
jgi:hypothetical protein